MTPLFGVTRYCVEKVLTGMSCPLHPRGLLLFTKMGVKLLVGMEREPPPYARYWALAVADLDPLMTKFVLSTAFLLVTCHKAAPTPLTAYRALLEGLLRDLGAPTPTPGDRPRDYPKVLDWALPAWGQVLRTGAVSQPLARLVCLLQ